MIFHGDGWDDNIDDGYDDDNSSQNVGYYDQEFYSSGELKKTVFYTDANKNKIDYVVTYYVSGRTLTMTDYDDNERKESETMYYENGNLKYIYTYYDDGFVSKNEYYENGDRKSYYGYTYNSDETIHGIILEEYNKDGSYSSKIFGLDEKLQNIWYYDSYGNGIMRVAYDENGEERLVWHYEYKGEICTGGSGWEIQNGFKYEWINKYDSKGNYIGKTETAPSELDDSVSVTEYDADRNPITRKIYVDGVLTGYIEYYEAARNNGEIRYDMKKWIQYHSNGQASIIYMYNENGDLTEEYIYDENGNEISHQTFD